MRPRRRDSRGGGATESFGRDLLPFKRTKTDEAVRFRMVIFLHRERERGKPLFLPPRQRFVEPFVDVQRGPTYCPRRHPSLPPFLRILLPSLLPSLWTMPIPLAWMEGKRKEQWPFLHFEPPLRAGGELVRPALAPERPPCRGKELVGG